MGKAGATRTHCLMQWHRQWVGQWSKYFQSYRFVGNLCVVNIAPLTIVELPLVVCTLLEKSVLVLFSARERQARKTIYKEEPDLIGTWLHKKLLNSYSRYGGLAEIQRLQPLVKCYGFDINVTWCKM